MLASRRMDCPQGDMFPCPCTPETLDLGEHCRGRMQTTHGAHGAGGREASRERKGCGEVSGGTEACTHFCSSARLIRWLQWAGQGSSVPRPVRLLREGEVSEDGLGAWTWGSLLGREWARLPLGCTAFTGNRSLHLMPSADLDQGWGRDLLWPPLIRVRTLCEP